MACPRPFARATWVAFAAAALLAVHVQAAESPTQPSIERFLKIRTPGQPAPLPDGSFLAIDRPDGILQLYRFVPGAAAGGAGPSFAPGQVTATKLTTFPDGLSGFSVSPDGKWVVLMHAQGGNENTQLTMTNPLAAPGSGMTPVLSNPKVQAAVNLWLRDGSGFIYSANADSPNDFYLYRYDIASRSTTKVLGKEGSWSASDITRDGKRALITHDVSASDVQVYELDLATGKLSDLSIHPADGTAACGIVGYMPDERRVLIQSDLKDGRQRLFLRDLRKGSVSEPIPALARYELDGALVDWNREMLAVVSNEDGFGVPHMYGLPDFAPLPAPTNERGVLGVSYFADRTLVWSMSNARTPGLAFATTFAKQKGAPPVTKQLTWADDQGVDLSQFPLPELVTYQAFDGVEIRAFLYLPAGYTKGTTIPFLMNYHGGPEGQSRPAFTSTMQYYLSRGYGVMMPNVRGSTGYGRTFQMMDDYKKRWDSVRDGVDAAEWLVKNGYADAGRIATYGGSYGGFMSVACLVEDQERVDAGQRKERLFGACVDVVGPVNLKTFLEKTSGYRRKLREVEYGPLTDPEFLASVSSIHRVDKINVPVFIGHGFNDPRVPIEEAMQLAAALRERGQNPRMFVAPDEGHGFAKLDNRVYFGERVASFLDETIGKPMGGSESRQ
jgi:dipeptidyl aminopeptidase/acylaminoacyl peptidase